MTIRPRRSVLYMPGSNARAIEKARTLPADGVILDLEDAVAPDAKAAAREQVAAAVKQGGFGSREVFIRVNGIDTPWHSDDVTAAALASPDAILVPKVSSPDQLEILGQRLLDLKADRKTRVWAMIETPAAILNLEDIARRRKRFRDTVCWPGARHQRSREGNVGASHSRPRADAVMDHDLRAGGSRLRSRHSGRRI